MKSLAIIAYTGASFILILIISIYIWNISRLPTKLELFVFDTKGQPSIFIRTPEDIRILIDGGANSDIIRYITNILPFYSRRIDAVIITGDEGERVSGLVDVINRYRVGQVVIPVITAKEYGFSSSTDQIYETLLGAIDSSHVIVRKVQIGDQIQFGKLSGKIIFPESIDKFKYSKSSPPELALKLYYGNTSFLLLGDIGVKAQKLLAGSLRSDEKVAHSALIVFHNISATTLFSGLINTIMPEFVIYAQSTSPDLNKSKTDPLYSVLGDHRFNIKQKNTIEVLSDGESIEIN